MKKIALMLLCAVAAMTAGANNGKKYTLASPDGRLQAEVELTNVMRCTLLYDGDTLAGWNIYLQAVQAGKGFYEEYNADGDCYNCRLKSVSRRSEDAMAESPFTRQARMRDHYNEMQMHFKGRWTVEFRAYDEGLAYRIRYGGKEAIDIMEEGGWIDFGKDYEVWAPYVSQYDKDKRDVMFETSFENLYTHARLSELQQGRLCFLPLLADLGRGRKFCLTESHLENYPGTYFYGTGEKSLVAERARCPKTVEQGGHNNLQMRVKERENYIAHIDGARSLPWRIMMVSADDAQLAANNMSYLLGAPSRVEDIGWIKPGKVAWDWWNNWNIGGVDFEAGINNDTYKHYIDFASRHGIEYVILDEGWAASMKADLMQVVPEIDLAMLTEYARQRNVGLILWAGYYAFERDMEQVCRHYSEMGIKGFKIDFMDRDDQPMTDFYYRAAEMCAKYKMVVDFHGAFKPAGLNRTYPNVLNFEGVAGLEQLKWAPASWDQVQYDTEIPFIRQTAGPMDYTQGAMRNAAKGCYHPCWSEPMSQGTRCHQLGLYIVLESPLNMLCDSPTNYEREPGYTDFVAGIPTVWDETRVLAGEVGQYIVTARRQGTTWYIGGITNWTARDIEIDLTQLAVGQFGLELYSDGTNAHRRGSDYRHQLMQGPMAKLKVRLAPGGGFVAKLSNN